jgi:hypothetical protein
MMLSAAATEQRILDRVADILDRAQFSRHVIQDQRLQIRTLSHQLAETQRQLTDALEAHDVRGDQ